MIKEIDLVCEKAKIASRRLGVLSTHDKNLMLTTIATALLSHSDEIIEANQLDVAACTKPDNIIDRLRLTKERIEGMAEGARQVATLNDPIGVVLDEWTTARGLLVKKVRVPMGVVGIIYEARPNVTIDTAALCLKSGNSVVLRGSKDAIESNRALVRIAKQALTDGNFDPECIQLIEETTHEGAAYFMTKKEYIDVLVPRGSAGLIQSTIENATIPVIETGNGNCHVYIEKSADIKMAKRILINAKTQRTSVCNACESMLIDDALLAKLPEILDELTSRGVIVHGCEKTCSVYPKAILATELDYKKEYLALEISCKVVENVEEAVENVEKYSTHHSDTIISNNDTAVKYFLANVDSATVYHNASTRFTDGFEFGFGAELGISTQKLHARGPIGLEELTSYKFIVEGHGEIR